MSKKEIPIMKPVKYKRNFLVHFDLDTEKLINSFGEKSYRNAYKKIANYFYDNNLVRDQYSGYKTKYPITKFEMRNIISNFAREMPEIALCVKRMSYSYKPLDYEFSNIVKEIANNQIEKNQVNKDSQDKNKINIESKNQITKNNEIEKD